ncbi:hypothetical protein K6W16_16905 [Burkholderia dolosa]|uniref:hypothetical protein n=1 Tax=Burkholderia TaxID=32008 RepID=UPI000FFC40E9|nr:MULTISPECIES: hypothetical protein [Burkholderia]MBR8420447.1 hypothetical protein [Burkholderia dolosa]MBY4657756.1 hypothetical protein [Burkholderia dolosa]MBY4690191.1 hypothetical protein [Burkholderia dolosa]MBY4784543.1 hypothetical protein [Burkholderia dolosa]MBY4786330.1 hypothetical protein [Burkholderia dolosa]
MSLQNRKKQAIRIRSAASFGDKKDAACRTSNVACAVEIRRARRRVECESARADNGGCFAPWKSRIVESKTRPNGQRVVMRKQRTTTRRCPCFSTHRSSIAGFQLMMRAAHTMRPRASKHIADRRRALSIDIERRPVRRDDRHARHDVAVSAGLRHIERDRAMLGGRNRSHDVFVDHASVRAVVAVRPDLRLGGQAPIDVAPRIRGGEHCVVRGPVRLLRRRRRKPARLRRDERRGNFRRARHFGQGIRARRRMRVVRLCHVRVDRYRRKPLGNTSVRLRVYRADERAAVMRVGVRYRVRADPHRDMWPSRSRRAIRRRWRTIAADAGHLRRKLVDTYRR